MKKTLDYLKKYYLYILVAVIVILVDFLTKIIFADVDIPIINGVLRLLSQKNTGVAFSFLEGKLILIISICVLFLILFSVGNHFFKNQNKLYLISVGLIFGGAIGNLIDRIFLGYVRDFIYFELTNFAIFNVADSCLFIGVVLLAIYFLFIDKKFFGQNNKTKNESSEKDNQNKGLEKDNQNEKLEQNNQNNTENLADSTKNNNSVIKK